MLKDRGAYRMLVLPFHFDNSYLADFIRACCSSMLRDLFHGDGDPPYLRYLYY